MALGENRSRVRKALGAALGILLTLACGIQGPPTNGTPFEWMWAASATALPTATAFPTATPFPSALPTMPPSPTPFPLAIVNTTVLNVRVGPGESYANPGIWYSQGAPVSIYATSNGWCEISQSPELWMKCEYLDKQ